MRNARFFGTATPREHIYCLINKCRSIRQLKQIHAQIITSPRLHAHGSSSAAAANTFLVSRLLFFSALSELGSLPCATTLFQTIQSPNLFMYNTMIRAYATCSSSAMHSSLALYKQMLSDGIRPDHITFPFLLKYCSRRQGSSSGQVVHSHVFKLGFDVDVFVQNSMITFYSACGLTRFAVKVFDEMQNRDIVSWNSILIGYLRSGELDFALELFRDMKEMNIVTWNSIITGFVQGGRPMEALGFFHEMLLQGNDGMRPDKMTVASVVSACASLGALDQGKWVHGYLKRQGLELDAAIGTALVDMYGKCGCLERAVEVFDEMAKKDILAWTAMISAFAVNGRGEEAFDVLTEMEKNGMRPNHVTFGALLSACAHSGMLKKGWKCFDMMRKVYSMEPNPQHYACMVDLLGRAALFQEALELIRSMPMEPDAYIWGALLGGCRMHGNVELGEKLSNYLISLDPLNHAFYIILSDIYAKAGRFDEVKKVRFFMAKYGIKKTSPGCSMIEVDGRVHEFSIQGTVDVLMDEITLVLKGITEELKFFENAPINDDELLEFAYK